MKVIKVTEEVYKRLKNYKVQLNLKDFSAVIIELSEFYGVWEND